MTISEAEQLGAMVSSGAIQKSTKNPFVEAAGILYTQLVKERSEHDQVDLQPQQPKTDGNTR